MSNPSSAPSTPRPAGTSFFDWLRSLGVTRGDDAWVAGVCSGIAARTGLDPVLVRGIAIVIAVLGGPAFLAYAAGWALLPDSRGRIHAETAVRGEFSYPMIFIGLAALLTFLPFTRGIWFDGVPGFWGMPDWLEITLRTLWVLALIAGGIWLTVVIARRVPRPGDANPAAGSPMPDASQFASAEGYAATAATSTTTTTVPDAGPSTQVWASPAQSAHSAQRARYDQSREESRARAEAWREAHPHPRGAGAAFCSIVVGIALVAAAMVGIGYGAIVPEGKLVLVISLAALAVLAVGIVIAGIRGRTSGGLGTFAFLAALAVVFTGVLPAGTAVMPFGTQNVEMSQALSTGPTSYLLIAGKTIVDAEDLTSVSPGGAIDVWLGAGQAEVIVPDDMRFRVESHVLAGTVTSSLGTERSGVFLDDDRLFTAVGGPAGIPTDSRSPALTTAQLERIPVIRIWLLAGTVSVVSESER